MATWPPAGWAALLRWARLPRMSNSPRGWNPLIGVGFTALGVGYLYEAFKAQPPPTPVGATPHRGAPLGSAGLPEQQQRTTTKNGVLVVNDGVRTIKFHPAGNIDNRVKFIVDQIRKDSADPKTVTEARAIVSGKCKVERGGVNWCVEVKDWLGELKMLFWAITNPNSPYAMRYTRDHATIDMFGSSESHRRLPAGDCFVHGTLVLRDDHKLVPVETLRVGDRIWGFDKWTSVMQTWEKGTLPTWLIRLNNGSSMRLTPDHKVWIRGKDGQREVIRVSELTLEHELLQPAKVDANIDRHWAPFGRLAAAEIQRDNLALPCFDFATEDQCIWLPEADWTVHNCDDMSIRLGALARAIGYPVKCRIVAPAGQPGQWAHIYLMVGSVPGEGKPPKWLPMDPTEAQHGPFWEVSRRLISSVKDYEV